MNKKHYVLTDFPYSSSTLVSVDDDGKLCASVADFSNMIGMHVILNEGGQEFAEHATGQCNGVPFTALHVVTATAKEFIAVVCGAIIRAECEEDDKSVYNRIDPKTGMIVLDFTDTGYHRARRLKKNNGVEPIKDLEASQMVRECDAIFEMSVFRGKTHCTANRLDAELRSIINPNGILYWPTDRDHLSQDENAHLHRIINDDSDMASAVLSAFRHDGAKGFLKNELGLRFIAHNLTMPIEQLKTK